MSHMVIYRGADGKPGYHQTDDIHDAVGFVEQMRNDEGVEHARIFRLEEVVFQYRPYFRVELAESGYGELAGGADGTAGNPADGGSTNGSGNGAANGVGHGSGHDAVNGSSNGELTITANGGGVDAANGSTDTPAGVASGSVDDDGGSKKGLFGR